MSLSVSDTLEYEALPDDIKELAKKYWYNNNLTRTEFYNEAYSRGYQAGMKHRIDMKNMLSGDLMETT